MLTPIDADVEAKPQMDKALMTEIPLNRLVKVAGKEFVGEQRGSTCSKNGPERTRHSSAFWAKR